MTTEMEISTFGAEIIYGSSTGSTGPCTSMRDQIKSEITFEEEKITETTFLNMPMEQINQIEIGEIMDNAEESFQNNNIGEMCELQSDEEQRGELNFSEISDALNDHNYTSQEIVLSQTSVKDVLLSHIVSNGTASETLPTHVSDFIDNTIDKIRMLRLENMDKKTDETLSQSSTNNNTNTANSISQNCSEPLEIEANDEYFESLYKNISENKLVSSALSETKDFAKDFYNECVGLPAKTEEEFKVFIVEKIHKLMKIANIVNTTDQSVQTSSKGSLRKRRRINRKAKRNLLDTSASSSTDTEQSSSCNEQKKDSLTESSILETTVDPSQSSKSDKISETSSRESDADTINLKTYVKMSIDKKNVREMSCEFESDGKEGSNSNSNSNSSSSSNDDTDKEIDRLTNLSGLIKRHAQNRPIKPADKIKEPSEPKTLSFKDANDLELDDDLETYDSDKSFKENVDEDITEHQYLSRVNEQIKLQLLNESNSDSGLSDQSDYNLSKESSSSESESKTDVVDKFLQVFNCDHDDLLKDDGTTDCKESKSEVEVVAKESDSFEVSDELWNDNFVQRKRSKKSLEKLLAEAEKRNQNEEIVLSSESEFSDVEPEPVEEKTRLIKPMLRMDQLANETRAAQKSESERIRRLEKKHVILSKAVKNSSGSASKSKLVLDYIEKTKSFIKVDEDIVKQLKPHQFDGIKFMYDSCYGGIDHTKKNSGSGCILAHCMGLGKTLQLIALLHTVISYKELNTSKVLVLCPKSTVMNWADELQRWLAPLKSNTPIKVFVFPDASDISDKLKVLEEWSLSSVNRAGCLLVGYEAFRTLVFYHSYKNRGNLSTAKLESIREKVNKYLLQPGADLVVCDEGHIIKNSKSAISLAVAKIITPKRIILTGTPIQNNLKEYYSMVNFIKPLYLGTEKEFANLYCNPIKNGQHKDSSKKDITVMKQRSFVLHKKLSKFVQRKEAELLKTFLPQKFEYVLFIPMTSVQNTLYEYILEAIAHRGDSRGKSLITDYTVLRKIWTHPKVLEDAWKNANIQKNKRETKKVGLPHSDDDQPDDIYDSQTGSISVTNDWWRKYLSKKDLETIMPSNKLRTMFSILRMCEEKGEKCLIFSAFVAVLNVVEYFFKKITDSDPEVLQHIHVPTSIKVSNTWINGQDYYRLDGKTPKNIRHEMIKRFNSEANRRARVFLISAKAGGQGINLIGANRVIILDTSWNPSNDQQNIFRIFRLGQKKNCYIYRLIAMGTMEEKVYSRSVTKQAMSFRVVDEQQIDRHYNMAELAELYTLTIPKQSERSMPLLPKDTILAHLLRQSEMVYKYHEHDSLLENKVEQELSEQEKTDAWDTYERELQMNLAQQEGLNAEKIQNAALAKLPPYLGTVPSLDMQTLLNFSLQSASLIPQYNYGAGNQSYLDSLNMYQKFSNMRYPDINAFINEASYGQSPFNVLSNPNLNLMQQNSSIMSNLPGAANAKAHSRDFNPYDAHNARNNSLVHPNLHHPLSTDLPSLANTAGNANANSVLSTLGQYKQMLENPLTSLLNYSAQTYPPPSTVESLHAGHTYAEKVVDAVESLSKKDMASKLKSSVDLSTATKSQSLPEARSTTTPIVSSVDLTTQKSVNVPALASFVKNPLSSKKHQTQHSTVDLTTPSLAATTTSAKNPLPLKKVPPVPNLQRMTNPQADEDKITTHAKTANVNFNSGYSSGRGSTLSKDFLKSNAEMQIIPTTSPPGTSSITKQLNEMSPSISLTAVNTLTEKSKSRTQIAQKNNATILSPDNRQTTSAFKTKKPVNPNFISLSKAVDNVLSSLSTTKTIAGKDKSVLMNFAQTAAAAAKAVASKKMTNSDSSVTISNSMATPQLNKISTPEPAYKVKPTGAAQSISNAIVRANTAILSPNASKASMEVNLQGENRNNISRKRSTESPKANPTTKRTKL